VFLDTLYDVPPGGERFLVGAAGRPATTSDVAADWLSGGGRRGIFRHLGRRAVGDRHSHARADDRPDGAPDPRIANALIPATLPS
jgi:hypothetical protein